MTIHQETSSSTWKNPRIAAWFFVSLLLIALPRLLFSPAQYIPYYVQLDPGCAFIPVCGIVFGITGAWGVFAGILLIDLVTELSLNLSLFTAFGGFLFSYSSFRLWNAFSPNESKEQNKTTILFRFLLAALPGCALMAVWVGFGSECMRLYPFPYISIIILIQNLLFVPLLGIPLILFFNTRVLTVRPQNASQKFANIERQKRNQFLLCMSLGSWGGLLIGLFLAAKVYHIQLLTPFIIGVTNCPWVIAGVTPFILLQLYTLFKQLIQGQS